MKTVLVTYNLPGTPPRKAITKNFVGAALDIPVLVDNRAGDVVVNEK